MVSKDGSKAQIAGRDSQMSKQRNQSRTYHQTIQPDGQSSKKNLVYRPGQITVEQEGTRFRNETNMLIDSNLPQYNAHMVRNQIVNSVMQNH